MLASAGPAVVGAEAKDAACWLALGASDGGHPPVIPPGQHRDASQYISSISSLPREFHSAALCKRLTLLP